MDKHLFKEQSGIIIYHDHNYGVGRAIQSAINCDRGSRASHVQDDCMQIWHEF